MRSQRTDDKKKSVPTSTVNRGRTFVLDAPPSTNLYNDDFVSLYLGDSLDYYQYWSAPTVIVSDGAYGILGFEGDTTSHLDIVDWYERHIIEWSKKATPETTLWFWNSEIGWATVHPILEKYGWRYVNANIWNKGKAHIAGNINTSKIRRFPVVTEICAHYVFEPKIEGMTIKNWLLKEWKRTGLPLRYANEACGVKDAAVRKYFDQGHLWYFPPADKFTMFSEYANTYGKPEGKPYFSKDGVKPMSFDEWSHMRSKFYCPVGFTNVWDRNPLHGSERIKVPGDSNKAAHLNQKPLDLMKLIIEASSDTNDVVWEPFGGLFSASLAAKQVRRIAFSAEIDPTYFQTGIERFM